MSHNIIQAPFGKIKERITIEVDERNQARLKHEKMKSPLAIAMSEVMPIEPIDFLALIANVMNAQLTQMKIAVDTIKAQSAQMGHKTNGG